MEGADLLSIRMELREVRGDGRPLLSCSGVTWDWKAGAPVPLGMLLPERSRRRQLLEGIRQAGEGELRSGSCLLDPDWKETARRKFRASRFCLRPEFSGPGGRGGALLPGAPGGGCVDGGGRDSLRDIKLGHGRIPLI